jgi:hypothetical protein
MDGLAMGEALLAGIGVGGGLCASALVARKQLIKTNDVNRYIGDQMPIL